MNAADRQSFVEVIVGFAELRGKQLSGAALELYWRAMRHWELSDFRVAAEQLLRTSEFMPTPKHFEDLRKAGRRTAGEAWAEILECARHRLPVPEDPILQQALRAIGGMRAVAMSEVDKTHFLERRFAEHFQTIQDAEDVRRAVPQIAYSNPHAKLSGPTPIREIGLLTADSRGHG